MLQRAASNAYSWWWASHIRTKQSKWLEHNLQDMEEKIKHMLRIINEDGDSFAKRVDMYYRKRPELIRFVEDAYRGYRALAERYDHLSGELQNANRTIATVFPEQVQFSMDGDGENNLPQQAFDSCSTFLSKDSPQTGFLKLPPPVKEGHHNKKASSAITAPPSTGLTKVEALEEIDKHQKGILMLQTEMEYMKSVYEDGLAKYLELENQITETQTKVSRLQDEFGIETIIEDDTARNLIAATALRSCQDTLGHLQEKQERLAEEAQGECQKIQVAHEKLKALKKGWDQQHCDEPGQVGSEMEMQEGHGSMEWWQHREKIKEQFELNCESNLNMTELAEKIDGLVNKVISLDSVVYSHSALVVRLRSETGQLQARIQSLEEGDKGMNWLEDSNSEGKSNKLREMEKELLRVRELNKRVVDKNHNLQMNLAEAICGLDHLKEKLQTVKQDEDVESEARALTNIIRTTSSKNNNEGMHGDHTPQSNFEDFEDHRDENQGSFQRASAADSNDVGVVQGKIIEKQSSSQTKTTVDDNDIGFGSVDQPEVESEFEAVNRESDEKRGCSQRRTAAIDIDEEVDQPQARSKFEAVDSKRDRSNVVVDFDDPQAAKDKAEKDLLTKCSPQSNDEMEEWEKILVEERSTILGDLREAQKRHTEEESKNRESLIESARQIKELRNANAIKDEEIHSLRQKLSSSSSGGASQQEAKPKPKLKPKSKPKAASDDDVLKQLVVGIVDSSSSSSSSSSTAAAGEQRRRRNEREASATKVDQGVEGKFRGEMESLRDHNLELWVRFSTSAQQIQKFQASILDLKGEVSKWSHAHAHARTPSEWDARPISQHLREIQAELAMWTEQNSKLREDLGTRLGALGNMDGEIGRSGMDKLRAARLQGEVTNMREECRRVAEEVRAGIDQATQMEAEIQKTLAKMEQDDFSNIISSSSSSSHHHYRQEGGFGSMGSLGLGKQSESMQQRSSRKVPLRAFLFGVKSKKNKPSLLACMRKY